MDNFSGSGPQMASERTHIQSVGFSLQVIHPALRNDPGGLREAVRDLFASAIAKKHNLDLNVVKSQVREDDGYFVWSEPV